MSAKTRMQVVVLAASKGGVGKTTLASALAIRAAKDGGRIALIDADPQGSLERWWELRGEPDNPALLTVPCNAEGLGLVVADGWRWVFIDTPPGTVDEIVQAISVADFVLIPCRPSAIDLEAMDHVVEICGVFKKPFAFVLNQVHATWKMADAAEKYLKADGRVLDARIGSRRAFVAAMTAGKSGPEVERDGKAGAEIDALWSQVKRAIATPARVRHGSR